MLKIFWTGESRPSDDEVAKVCASNDHETRMDWSGWNVMNYDQEAHAKFDFTRQYRKL